MSTRTRLIAAMKLGSATIALAAATPLYAKVGPKVFPGFLAGGLILLGLALLWEAWSGRWKAEDSDESQPIDWRALGWLGFGLLFNVVLIGHIGFILASTVLFASVARAFGSTKPLRDLAIAFVFALVVYLGFAKLLGINMGTGLVERFL